MKNNIGLFLAKRAQLSPGVEAYVDADTGARYSYPDLNRRCNRTANALRERGVKMGDRVALLTLNSVEFVETFFALAKIGAVAVPLNWRLVPDEMAFILADSGCATLVYGDEFAKAAADLQARGADATAITRFVHVGDADACPDFAESYAAMVERSTDAEPQCVACDDDLLFIMYTSGTTGLPKGAVHTHETATWACLTARATTDARLGDRFLLCLPLFHIGALGPLMNSVHGGATAVVLRTFDPAKMWATIKDQKITNALAVPAMLNFMLKVYDPGTVDHSSLRYIMSGASPVPVSLIEEYQKLGIEIHQVYGLTEACGPACLIGPDDAMKKAGSTGKAFFHTDIRVVNDNGDDVAPDEPGEVLVRGRHVMREYWNRPEATAETIRDGWLHTGDVATVDDEGFVTIRDRTKDMIISGGENVYPAEIENVIRSHEKVGDVAVIGQKSAKWGESALAIVVKADDALTEQDVLSYCDGKLARFKLPRAARFIDELPRNPTGKVLKRLLRERYPEPAPE